MYDHNQTLVPDAFLALFVRQGRATAERAEIEARHEFAETLALHVAALPAVAAAEPGPDRAAALERCRAGLLAAPAQLSEAEAGWVVQRVDELLQSA